MKEGPSGFDRFLATCMLVTGGGCAPTIHTVTADVAEEVSLPPLAPFIDMSCLLHLSDVERYLSIVGDGLARGDEKLCEKIAFYLSSIRASVGMAMETCPPGSLDDFQAQEMRKRREYRHMCEGERRPRVPNRNRGVKIPKGAKVACR